MIDEIDSVVKKLINWNNGKKSGPDAVQIYPTNGCNLKCIFCVQQTGIYDLKDTISKNRWFEVVREICDMKPREILISGGGEPLFTPDVTLGIMKIIKDFGITGRIITNGTLWTESIIKETIEMSWDHVIFSIDGLEKTHDFLRGVEGSFKKTVETMRIFNTIKERMKKNKPLLEITTVLNTYNYKEIPFLIELGNSLKLSSINIEPLCINNPEDTKLRLDIEQRKEFFKDVLPKAKRSAEKYDIFNNFDRLERVRVIEKAGELKNTIIKDSSSEFFDAACFEPWIWPKIEANGEVWPCSTVSLKENINDKSFSEIWFGKKFDEFRKKILNKELPEECNNCVITHIEKTESIKQKLKNFKQRTDL